MPCYRIGYRGLFASGQEDDLNNYMFPLAVLLTKRERLVLVTIYLGSLYSWMDECVSNIARSMSCYIPLTHMDFPSNALMGPLRRPSN